MNIRKHTALLGLTGVVMISCLSVEATQSQESADMILSGAKIFTSNHRQPWAEAVAIRNGQFVYVGDSAGAAEYRSTTTQSIDLGGRLVIAGLIDAHAHPGYVDVEQYGEISETNEEKIMAAVK